MLNVTRYCSPCALVGPQFMTFKVVHLAGARIVCSVVSSDHRLALCTVCYWPSRAWRSPLDTRRLVPARHGNGLSLWLPSPSLNGFAASIHHSRESPSPRSCIPHLVVRCSLYCNEAPNERRRMHAAHQHCDRLPLARQTKANLSRLSGN